MAHMDKSLITSSYVPMLCCRRGQGLADKAEGHAPATAGWLSVVSVETLGCSDGVGYLLRVVQSSCAEQLTLVYYINSSLCKLLITGV